MGLIVLHCKRTIRSEFEERGSGANAGEVPRPSYKNYKIKNNIKI
jgi:hypothetical protein